MYRRRTSHTPFNDSIQRSTHSTQRRTGSMDCRAPPSRSSSGLASSGIACQLSRRRRAGLRGLSTRFETSVYSARTRSCGAANRAANPVRLLPTLMRSSMARSYGASRPMSSTRQPATISKYRSRWSTITALSTQLKRTPRFRAGLQAGVGRAHLIGMRRRRRSRPWDLARSKSCRADLSKSIATRHNKLSTVIVKF